MRPPQPQRSRHKTAHKSELYWISLKAYLISAGNRKQLRRGLQLIFLRRSQIYVLPHIRRIEIDERQTAATLKVWVLVTGTRISLDTLDLDVRGDVLQVTADLEYDEVWRVSGARWKRIPLARMIAEKLVD